MNVLLYCARCQVALCVKSQVALCVKSWMALCVFIFMSVMVQTATAHIIAAGSAAEYSEGTHIKDVHIDVLKTAARHKAQDVHAAAAQGASHHATRAADAAVAYAAKNKFVQSTQGVSHGDTKRRAPNDVSHADRRRIDKDIRSVRTGVEVDFVMSGLMYAMAVGSEQFIHATAGAPVGTFTHLMCALAEGIKMTFVLGTAFSAGLGTVSTVRYLKRKWLQRMDPSYVKLGQLGLRKLERKYAYVQRQAVAVKEDPKYLNKATDDLRDKMRERHIQGYTIAHMAAIKDDPEVIHLLYKAGADLHAKDDHGHTPLDLAAQSGSVEAFDRIRSLGTGCRDLLQERDLLLQKEG